MSIRPLISCHRPIPGAILIAIVAIAFWSDSAAWAQRTRTTAPKGYRKLVPGTETVIPAPVDTQDTITRHDVVEIQSAGKQLDWKPESQPDSKTLRLLTKDYPFYRSAWYFEFAFKPLRMLYVDMPRADGRMERRLIWYMVYRVKNLGQHLDPDPGAKQEKVADAAPNSEAVYFHPQFVLESHEYKKSYLDRVLPLAVQAIQKREDPNRRLLNSVEMSEQPMPLSTAYDDRSVWGVATWEHVDPRMDYFSVYVKGLSNAYRFADPPGAYQFGDAPGKGRVFAQKTLKLNFWRPGDEFDLNEAEIYYGIPGQVDHEWVFR